MKWLPKFIFASFRGIYSIPGHPKVVQKPKDKCYVCVSSNSGKALHHLFTSNFWGNLSLEAKRAAVSLKNYKNIIGIVIMAE